MIMWGKSVEYLEVSGMVAGSSVVFSLRVHVAPVTSQRWTWYRVSPSTC